MKVFPPADLPHVVFVYQGVNKSSQAAKLEENSFSVKRYAVNYLKVIGCGRVAQAVAPTTPDHYFECNGVPYFFDDDLFSKVHFGQGRVQATGCFRAPSAFYGAYFLSLLSFHRVRMPLSWPSDFVYCQGRCYDCC